MALFSQDDKSHTKRSHEGANMSHHGPSESKCLKVTFSPKKGSGSTSRDEMSKRWMDASPAGIQPNKDDVLSVVIDKLTELVNDSEKSRSENLSRGNKKADQLHKCPKCTCLFALSPEQLKGEISSALCKCCKKSQNAANGRVKSHLSKDQQMEVIECELCQHNASTHLDLLYHYMSKHADAKICKCKLCDYFTTDAVRIKQHAAAHTAPHMYKCSSCSFVTEKLVILQEHMKDHNKDKKLLLRCSECGFSCQCEDVLRTHMWEHIPSSRTASLSPARQQTTGTGYRTSNASVVLHGSDERNSANLSLPTVTSDEQPIFKCLLCGYFCARLATLKAHVWRHAGEKECSYPVVDEDECLKQSLSSLPSRMFSSVGETSLSSNSNDSDTDNVVTVQAACKSTTCRGCCGPGNSKEIQLSDCCCKGINIPSSVSVIKQLLTQKKNDTVKQNASGSNEVISKDYHSKNQSKQHKNDMSQSKGVGIKLSDASVMPQVVVPSDPHVLVMNTDGQIPEPAVVVEAVTENYIEDAMDLESEVSCGEFSLCRKSKKRPHTGKDFSCGNKTKSFQHTYIVSDSLTTTAGHESQNILNDTRHEDEIQCSTTATKETRESAADDRTDCDLEDFISSSAKTLTQSHGLPKQICQLNESQVSVSSAGQSAVQGEKSYLNSQGIEAQKLDSSDELPEGSSNKFVMTKLKIRSLQQTIIPHQEANKDECKQTKEPLPHVRVTGFMLNENITKLPSTSNTGSDSDLQESQQSKLNKPNKHAMEERLNEIVKRAKRVCCTKDNSDIADEKEQSINTKSVNGGQIESNMETEWGQENKALEDGIWEDDPLVKYFMNVVNGSNRPYQCKLCSESYTEYNLLKQHLQTHLVHNSFRCPLCKKSFESLNCLRQHIQEHYQETRRCQECFSSFQTTFELEAHQQSHKGLKKFSCDVCKVTITGQAGYVNHLENVHSTHQKIQIRCTHCEELFENTNKLLLHTISCAKRKMWCCKECGCSCQTSEGLQDHIKVCHLKSNMYKCDLCHYKSSAKHGIKNHMKFHAKNKPYKCHMCNFTGAYPQSLLSHMKMHSQPDCQPECLPFTLPEQYKCKLCCYTCNYLPSLKSHMWKHASDPDYNYKASQSTDKSSSTAGSDGVLPLSAAMCHGPQNKPEAVANLVTFCCQECGFQSQDRDNLIEHLKLHLPPEVLMTAQNDHNRK